jgi:hypothetical protein
MNGADQSPPPLMAGSSHPSEFPDLGDWVPVNRKSLEALVTKTPLQMHEFEKLTGCDFRKEAPQKKKELGWELLQLGNGNLKIISELRKAFPQAYITVIRYGAPGSVCDDVGDARPDGGA